MLRTSFLEFNAITTTNDFAYEKFQLIESEIELIKQQKLDILTSLIDRDCDLEKLLIKSDSLKTSCLSFKNNSSFISKKAKSKRGLSSALLVIVTILLILVVTLNWEILITLSKIKDERLHTDKIPTPQIAHAKKTNYLKIN